MPQTANNIHGLCDQWESILASLLPAAGTLIPGNRAESCAAERDKPWATWCKGESLNTASCRSLKALTSGELTWMPGAPTALALLPQVSPNKSHFQQDFSASLTTAAALELCWWCLCDQFQGKGTVTTVQAVLFIWATNLWDALLGMWWGTQKCSSLFACISIKCS